MRVDRFFFNEKIKECDELIIVDKNLLKQWQKVLRLKVDDQIVLFDGLGFDFEAEFLELNKGQAKLKVLGKAESLYLPRKDVWLLASMIKKDKFEWVLQKGTELGVNHFVPIISERSEKINFNIERGAKIVQEASEQSGRGNVPELFEPIVLKNALENFLRTQTGCKESGLFVFDLSADNFDASKLSAQNSVGLLIGPEGGWGEEDKKLFEKYKTPTYSLCSQILRAETASIIAVSKLLCN